MRVVADAVAELQQAVMSTARLLPVGGRTKPGLSRPPAGDVRTLETSKVSGVLEYNPAELTFTALAGTPVMEVEAMLAEHGQHLPFDPPFATAGATLGGVVATGVSGSNAYRRGGVRDFIIGAQLIDGAGNLISGGGKVVKNAAGFDLPKLLVGSIGRLGVITQLSFKVFPRPQATLTLSFELRSRARSLCAMASLACGPLEIEALDLDHEGRLLVRLGGERAGLQARADRCVALLQLPAGRLEGTEDALLWQQADSFSWVPAGHRLIRVALTLGAVPALERVRAELEVPLRLSLGGNAAAIAWPESRPLEQLDQKLRSCNMRALVLTGPPGPVLLGGASGGAFGERIRRALDPDGRFLAIA